MLILLATHSDLKCKTNIGPLEKIHTKELDVQLIHKKLPVSARFPAVGVHLCPPVPHQVMKAQLTGGVVVVEVPP